MDADKDRAMTWTEFGRLAALALLSKAGLILVVVAEYNRDSRTIILCCFLAVECWVMAFIVLPWSKRIRSRDSMSAN